MSKTARPDKRERRSLLTVYGRNAVLEAMQDRSLECRTLHLASSNRSGGSIRDISVLAERLQLDTRTHTREALARISRNGRQDQGVALDIYCPQMRDVQDYINGLRNTTSERLLALDGVTNPQNMGMAIRSAAAAGIHGVLYAERGNPALGPLVIKASAGAVFRAPLLRCASVAGALGQLADAGFALYRLQADSAESLYEKQEYAQRSIFVLGGETHGVSEAVSALPGKNIAIPMAKGVESLNVAVSAALLCYELRRRAGVA
ncbi:MAG: TrmH family RNA methyltransferase [Congregibacter sp.]